MRDKLKTSFVAYVPNCFGAWHHKLKFDDSKAIDIQFFDIRKLTNNISPPDKLVIEKFLDS